MSKQQDFLFFVGGLPVGQDREGYHHPNVNHNLAQRPAVWGRVFCSFGRGYRGGRQLA